MLARERPLKGAKEEEEATDNGGSHLMAGLSAHASLICNRHTIHSFACSKKDQSLSGEVFNRWEVTLLLVNWCLFYGRKCDICSLAICFGSMQHPLNWDGPIPPVLSSACPICHVVPQLTISRSFPRWASQPLHYWLRWSIGFWNIQKVAKSRHLFLIQ